MELFHYVPGSIPFILSIPHTGTFVPKSILEQFTPKAQLLPDTDWHLETLYAFAKELGIHMLVATHSRYVVDLNRPPDGKSLYPGQFTTGLCPHTLFDGTPIYLDGKAPDTEEVEHRRITYWQPYHDKLQTLIATLKETHKRVLVFDAHSICSQVPKLFEGVLPDLNVGTVDGQSMSAEIADKVESYCKNTPYSSVMNGRFKGGYITRHYGNPKERVDAIQLELAALNYMNESYPFNYDPSKAAQLQKNLLGLLSLLAQEMKI